MVYKVYISSTKEDLAEYRDAVRDVVVKLGMQPVLEDDFGLAANEHGMKYLKSQLMECDIFVGMYAYYYGHPVAGTGKSIEEMEYEWAVASGKNCILFNIHPDAPWPVKLVDRSENAQKLDAFKEKMMREQVVTPFASMYELQTLTFLALHQSLELLHNKDGMVLSRSVFGKPLEDEQFMTDFFMIMPFREKFETTYRNIVVPLISDMGATIKRGDDYFSQHAIIREVWSAIYTSKVYIAELTDRNPNVFYELGIAHTIGKPGIMMTQNIEDIPFDIRHLRFIVYEDSPSGLVTLREQLQGACQQLLVEYHNQ